MGKFRERLQQRAESVSDIHLELEWAKTSLAGAIGVLIADVVFNVTGGTSNLELVVETGVAIASIGTIAFETVYIPIAKQEAQTREG